MRKRMLFLALSLGVLGGALAAPAAKAAKSCQRCTYYADGSKCCISCICENGIPIACTNNYCPPAGGGDR